MKNKLLIIFIFCVALARAQQGNVTLTWRDGHKTSVGASQLTIPAFQGENMVFDEQARILGYRLNQRASGPVNEASLAVTNVVFQSITREQLGSLSPNNIPQAITPKIASVKARDDWRAVISLFPIVREGNAFKRIVSFSYSYTISTGTVIPRNVSDFNVISNSVLASGEWHRFYVEKSGVYRISRDFLRQLGVNVNVDPRNIKIYGNGGRMAPLLNATPYPADLEENAINFAGEEDGVFNEGDYILFYAEGVDNWNAESETHNNLYADRSYYYVTSSGTPGKRITTAIQPTAAANVTVTAFDDYQYHERDRINIARVGRKWHGEEFNLDNEQEFRFSMPDLDSPTVSITVSAAAAAAVTGSTMEVKANGQDIGALSFGATDEYTLAREGIITGNASVSGSEATVTLKYNNNGVPGSNAWLDYIILKSKRRLRGTGRQFHFQYNAAASNIGVVQYQFTGANGIAEVWDVTDIYNVSKLPNVGDQANFAFKAAMGEARRYVTVVHGDFFTPLRESNARVANQNIKGTIFRGQGGQLQDIDYLIITPEFLRQPAERLAAFHKTDSNLNVKVVSTESIYQEFGSGKQDIAAIRNFIKYVYNNAVTPGGKVKYVNLFGDASFDYKNRIPNNTNIVPTLHALDPSRTRNFSEVSTFMSDDFFVLMDATEGQMPFDVAIGPDIAVGRMLVSSRAQADQMVHKVFEYKSRESYGRWRNEYVVVSDDIDNATDVNFVPVMDELADTLVASKPFVNVRKIYIDAYVQQATSGGQRYPEAKDQIIRSINFGTLVLNYLGHGGENGMASENIFSKADAQNLNNKFKYPLFITATCDLTKFDNPYRLTAGEYLYWNTNGGAICLITTTRAIFISAAVSFNEYLSPRLYAFGSTEYPSMAEAVRLTKAEVGNGNYNVISFVGDPALKLAIPRPKIVLTEVNGQPASSDAAVLEALSHATIKGQVTDEAGNVMNGYNGELAVSVFDKPVNRQTLNNDGASKIIGYNPNGTPIYAPAIYDFATLGETIFRGNATVANGQFQFGFVVPRDIRIPVAAGRVSFYSKRNGQLEDQAGFDNTVKIGGLNEDAAVDNTGPRVKLYMNDTSFISGGITNESPIFLAFLEDENGINTASGIGHDILAILDGDEANPYILNDYYDSELDDYTKGSIRYPFTNLAPGLHTITFKAWDVYNNLVTAEIQFIVIGDERMYIEKVLNYPNPFVSYTEFWFTHNRPFEPLDVQVQVFTITGKVVKTINQSVLTNGFLCRDIKWDGKDDFGDRIGKGVYVYKLTVRSTSSGKTAEKYEKLVLL